MDAPLPRERRFSNRALLALAVPIFFENMLAVAAGLADSVMVSSAGAAAVSAVSLIDSVNVLFIQVFAALINGGAVVVAQYIGRGDRELSCDSGKQLYYFLVLLATSVMAALMLTVPLILGFLYPDIEADVLSQAKTYFYVTLIGYPFLAATNTNCALFRVMAKSRFSLFIMTGVNILNILGNAVFIYGFGLGVFGAAAATTLARIVGAVVSTLMLRNDELPVCYKNLLKVRFYRDTLVRVFKISIPNGIEALLFQSGKIFISSLISSFGTVMIAADSISHSVSSLPMTANSTFRYVILTTVGQSLGAGEKEEAKYYVRKIVLASTAFMIVVFGGMFVFRRPIVSIYDLSPEVFEAAVYYTGVGLLCNVFGIYSCSFDLTYAFRAAGDVRFTMILAFLSMFIFRVGFSYLLGGYLALGIMGTWLAYGADLLCRSVFNIIHYARGKWLTKKVI